MENRIVDGCRFGRVMENSLNRLSKDSESLDGTALGSLDPKSQKVRKLNSQHDAILEDKKLQRSKSCTNNLFRKRIDAFDGWVPRYVVNVDEKCLSECLEFIRASAFTAAPVNMDLEDISIRSDSSLNKNEVGKYTHDLGYLNFDFSWAAETRHMVDSGAAKWIVGSIMGSKSMESLLKSPLLCQNRTMNIVTDFKSESLGDAKGSICYQLLDSPGQLDLCLSYTSDKETPISGSPNCGSETRRESSVSTSSTNSTCSDQTSPSFPACVMQGMLQCTRKGRNSHFVFSVDKQKLVYMANLFESKSRDNKVIEYTYLFFAAMPGGQKEHLIRGHKSQILAKMTVSTSFTVCPCNSRIIEREFVLFDCSEDFVRDVQSSSQDLRKTMGLSKKINEVFRTSHSFKKRTTSIFRRTGSTLENYSQEKAQNADNSTVACNVTDLLDNQLPSNLEVAAMVVKDHLPGNRKGKVEGWGLNFLQKVGEKQTARSTESSVSSTCCAQDNGDCLTSMDVLIPAGLHGGPRTRENGPSSLVERWRTGGCRNCGGWDLGCPLTVLQCKSSENKILAETDTPEECKLIDLCVQGSGNGAPPPLRMVNVHDGLYFVHFQPTLSALQSFAIAVAFIHTQMPCLRPENVDDMEYYQ